MPTDLCVPVKNCCVPQVRKHILLVFPIHCTIYTLQMVFDLFYIKKFDVKVPISFLNTDVQWNRNDLVGCALPQGTGVAPSRKGADCVSGSCRVYTVVHTSFCPLMGYFFFSHFVGSTNVRLS